MRVPHAEEQGIIDRLLAACPAPAMPVGPGDDAAVLPGGHAVTVDALVQGVHWDHRLSPADVAYKAVAVSVSDLGAMGAAPAWMVLALCLPRPVDHAWVDTFARGLGEACRSFGVALVGGDLTASPGPAVVSVTLGGACVANPLIRAGGQPGDRLWVSGTPGLAGAGYRMSDPPPAALAALRRPRPPLAFALDLARSGLAHAAMDLSDGLASDLPRLAAASGLRATLRARDLPLHDALAGLEDPLPLQLGAGDDYELLLAAPPESGPALRELAIHHGVRLTEVGELGAGEGVELEGAQWPEDAFCHFPGAPRPDDGR